jgi:hypothetical protein
MLRQSRIDAAAAGDVGSRQAAAVRPRAACRPTHRIEERPRMKIVDVKLPS